MGKSKRLKKRFQAFVDGLTHTEAKEQLVLAYLQMEKCINVLRGHDVEPVEMLDNGESSDLELFYRCKKVRKELDLLENERTVNGWKEVSFKPGDEVWYLDIYPHKSRIDSMQFSPLYGWTIHLADGKVFFDLNGLFASFDELADSYNRKLYKKCLEEFKEYGKR